MGQLWEYFLHVALWVGALAASLAIHSQLEGIALYWECSLYVIVLLLAAVSCWSLRRRRHHPRKGEFMVTSRARRTESGLGFLGPLDYVNGLPKSPDRKKRELFNRARSQQAKDHHKAAIDLFQECLDMPNSPREQATLQLQIGNSFFHLGDVGRGLPAYQAALSKARQVEDSELEGTSLNSIGLIYTQKGEPDKALTYYKQTLEIVRKIDNPLGEANVLTNIGSIYLRKGKLDKALTHYKQALEIHRRIDNPLGEANDLGNIGLVYAGKGKLDKALTHHKQALEIDRRIDNPLGQAQDLANVGFVLLKKGLDEEAKLAFESSYRLYMELEAKPAEVLKVKNALDSLKDIS